MIFLGKSSVEGGILGWLEAFYGIAEYTGRGDHHWHFLLWLLGALNPADLHEKLESTLGFDHEVFVDLGLYNLSPEFSLTHVVVAESSFG